MESDASVDLGQGDLFRAVRREATLANQVIGELEALIVDGRLAAGSKLPSERDLADQFGVSRTVVREAVRGLVARGWLEVRPGSGSVISSPSSGKVAQSMSLLLRGGAGIDYGKIHELRSVLEIEIAGLAATRHTTADLELLRQNVEEMRAIVGDGSAQPQRDAYVLNDMAFHAALARTTQNELFSLVLDSVAVVLRQVREMTFGMQGTHLHALRFHSAIYERIAAGDAPGARAAMQAHLADSRMLQEQALLRGLAAVS